MMESAGLQLAWRKRLGLFLLLLLLSAAGVFDHSLWSNDAREGAMIAEMVRNNTWTTPTFNGVAYLEKPPLMHWTAVLLCRMTGRINASMTRLPAALYGFAAMLLVVAMAREMDRERSGWLAAFMCATSALYFEYSRVVLTDTTLAFMVMLALFIFWRAWRAKKPAIALHITFMVVAALSFYAKGLLGPGLIWVTVCIFLALQRAWKRMLILPLVFVPIFLLTLLPWTLALYRVGGMEFLNTVFWANQFGRFLTFTGPDLPVDPYFVHKQPFWFYITRLPARILPWTFFVLAALPHWFRHDSPLRGHLPTLLRAALMATILVLHASSAKAAAYAMPLFPILFLMTGIWFEDALQHWTGRIEKPIIIAVLSLLAWACLLAALGILGCIAAGFFGWRIFWIPGPSTTATAAFLAIAASCLSVYLIRAMLRGIAGERDMLLRIPIHMAAIAALLITAAIPAYDFQRTYKPAALMAKKELDSGRCLAVITTMERDHGQFLFYLNTKIDRMNPDDDLRAFLEAEPGKRGLIVPEKHHSDTLAKLDGIPLQTRKTNYPGYKSAQFSILLDDRKGTHQ